MVARDGSDFRWLWVALVLAGCGDASRPAMLSELPAFSGRLRIESSTRAGDVRVLEGDLEYDRSRGFIAFSRRAEGARVELRKDGGGPLVRTVDGSEAEVTIHDAGDFTLLMQVLQSQPPATAEVRTTDSGYEIVHGEQRLEVSMTPLSPPPNGQDDR